MPSEDVSDFKDVFEAIDRLCENMKTSNYDDEELYEDCSIEAPRYVECGVELVSPDEVSVRKVEIYTAEKWTDETTVAACEPVSEMYYTASSEVSLLSDLDVPERVPDEDVLSPEMEKDDRKECVIAGHVAAMRERFESMTRTNTPCPDLMSSTSPSLDVFRMTPSPDDLG